MYEQQKIRKHLLASQLTYNLIAGHRNKIESRKAKFYGQLLASFMNRIGEFYNF